MGRIAITLAIVAGAIMLPTIVVQSYRRWQGRCPRCGSIGFEILQNDGTVRETCGERCGWFTIHG